MAVTYDVFVIGAGPGGYTAAIKAASLGFKTGVIEKEKLGGTCLNRGCIPTKALLHASSLFSMMQNCDEFGVSVEAMSFDFKKMQASKKKAVEAYRSKVEQKFEELGIDLIYGIATIRRGHNVEVHSNTGKEYYSAKHILIATGAVAKMPQIPGIDLEGIWNSDRLLAADSWNFDRITIIGGGVIGVEVATIFNSLCSKVSIIEQGSQLLGPIDQQVAKELEQELIYKGISVYCNAALKEITKEDSGLVCHFIQDEKEMEIHSGQVLMAIGRTPNMEGLFGEDVEFKMENGRLAVNEAFMTSEPEVYAIGDVIADIQLAHVAAAQGTFVVENIAKIPHSIQLTVVPNGMYARLPVVPSCIYTDPEIATVGLTEEAAKACGMKVVSGEYSMSGNGKSIISHERGGFIHLVFDAYSMNLVGAQFVCPRATDMIGEMATAIAAGLTARQLQMAMRAHPTYSEGIGMAIEDALQKVQIKR